MKIKNHRLFDNDDKQVAQIASSNVGRIINPLYIVLHDTASPLSVQGDIDWLSGKNNKGSSAHFVVARNGAITQLVPTNRAAWHAGKSKWNGRTNCNDFTIGIEIDNPGKVEKVSDNIYRSYFGQIVDNDLVDFAFAETPNHGRGYWAFYTKDQIESVISICRALIEYYGCTEIITHWMISPGRKVDTNPLFPLEQVRERSFGNRDIITEEVKIKFNPDASILVNNLNVRSVPNMGNNVIGVLNAGDRVDIQEVSGEWFKILTKDLTSGYVYKSFVKMD